MSRSFWLGRRVLVTGAAGFIGSHLTEHLVSLGAEVRAFIRYTSRSDQGLLTLVPPTVLEQVEILAGDLRDSDAVREAVRGVDTLFHLGALIAIPYSYLHPREVVETNVLGTLNVLMAARDAGIRRLIHTSTSEVYGTALYVPIDEAHQLQGQSPYSASKIGADKLAESFWRSYEVPVTICRPFNTYGPRQTARAVIPTIVSQALSGDTVRLGAVDPSRDFTFVSDTVSGFLALAESPRTVGQVLNLGTGVEVTIGALAETIFRLLGRSPQIILEPRRLRPKASEVERLCANAARVGELTGWQAEVQLEEGLRRTITWIRNHLASYRPEEYEV